MEARFERPQADSGDGGRDGTARRVAVVCDTTAYLPAELVAAYGIELVSLYVNWDDGSEREGDMPGFDAFYDRLRAVEQLPTTSQPSIGDFLAVYEPLLGRGLDVVSIHISGGISGTVESARQATERLSDRDGAGRVTVIDSETACGGMGFLALAAAKAAQAGADAAEVAERAREARQELKMWFAVDTLEYLRRGGRIGAASAWIGTALKVKPILTLESEITPVERVRTAARAMQRLTDYAEQRKDDGADAWVVQHIQAPDEAARLVERAQEIMGKPPLYVSEVGPVIGAHVGPGLLGIGGVPERVLDPASPAGVAGETTT
jgi:fatty acid kinase fatty acid binding subunit